MDPIQDDPGIKEADIDPVCGMRVLKSLAQRQNLWDDYQGKRCYFCSDSCRQAFLMNPLRFLQTTVRDKEQGWCELCSKVLMAGDTVEKLTIREKTYQFCCRTCASVYGKSIRSDVEEGQNIRQQNEKSLQNSHLCGWLTEAVRRNASDLFLSESEKPVLKVYGVFEPLTGDPLARQKLLDVIDALLSDAQKARFRQGGEIDLGMDVPGLSRFRINIFRQRTGLSLAIRPIPYRIPALEELRLPAVFRDFLHLKHGLLLITGPAGSGKSTTLAALINAINGQFERHIITIEDPIEFVIPNQKSLIHQREVGVHTESFADGLRNALRENPDIIVVGELRDLESISLAIQAAETGHFVLGTLHSGTAIQTLTRILDVFDSARQPQIRIQLAQSLQAICSQHLFPRKDAKGMVVATEIMIATLALRNIIRQNRVQEIRGYMETGSREKMNTIKQSVQALIREGMIGSDAKYDILGSSVLGTQDD